MTELGLISLKELLRVFTVSSDMRWCTGTLLDLASDFCVKVKVVAVSPPDRDPGDVRGRISLTQSLTHSLFHSPTDSLTDSLIH